MNDEDQIAELTEAMHHTKVGRMFERYQAVLLYMEGYPAEEIAHIIHRSPTTVSNYLKAYQADGIRGLAPGQSTGRPRRLTQEQEGILVETIITKTPTELKLSPYSNWTLALIAQYILENWGFQYSLRGVSIMMKRLGLSYTRPTYTLEKADPEKQRKFREETFPNLKKN